MSKVALTGLWWLFICLATAGAAVTLDRPASFPLWLSIAMAALGIAGCVAVFHIDTRVRSTRTHDDI